MKKWLLALAMSLATQANAATLEPSVLTGWLKYTIGDVDYDASLYKAWKLILSVNGDKSGTQFSYGWTSEGANPDYAFVNFQWDIGTNGPASVVGTLEMYSGVYSSNTTYGSQVPFASNADTRRIVFDSVTFGAAKTPAPSAIAEIAPSVVPIAGTLPLMLSALGLFGFLARRRMKGVTA